MFITSTQWGAAALHRAVRDGSVVELRPGVGVSSDVDRTRGVRGASLAPAIPRGAALTGVSALWVAGWRGSLAAPAALTVAVTRGARPDRPPAYDGPWRCITDDAAVRRATARGEGNATTCVEPADACAAALAYEPEAIALPAVHWALASGLVTHRHLRASLGRLSGPVQHARALRLYELLMPAPRAA